ncbi:MAG: hypothetical protein H0U32_02900 [Thermoleophilaceae bacterium]|nr:hypothetical protein [Thermoleophilaceae bacterium]
MTSTKSPKLLAITLLAALAVLAVPSTAPASPSQLSLIQDDRELLGLSGQDPAASMAELKRLGVDVVRTNVIFHKIYNNPRQRKKPAGFNASNPNDPRYDWGLTDRLVNLARQNGIQVLMTITGPPPHFATEAPRRCRAVPCTFRPKPRDFGQFAAAAAKRYRGRVAYYSIWNEPNLNVWLTPQQKRPGGGRVQTEAAIYRKLWIAGYKSIAKNDPGRRNRVLFGETAAIGEPLSLFRAALCLDESGKPFKGSLARKHGCSGRPAKLNIGGFAIHPYNFGGYGTPRSRVNRSTALPIAYVPRIHKVINIAARRGRITRRAPVFVTEFGFQTKPPDRFGRSLAEQAQFINESDRLFYGDRRVAMVAQYELSDVPERDQFNSGLRFTESKGRGMKPAYDAYRLPLVVTRRSARSVEVYGQVRPGLSNTVQLQSSKGGAFAAVRSVKTNGRGFFRITVRGSGAAAKRYRLSWIDAGTAFTSRVARAGKPLRYRR